MRHGSVFHPARTFFRLSAIWGGRVVYRDFFLTPKAESIFVRSEADFDIFVPHETSAARDRFTIAHELGHLLLHYPQVVAAHSGADPIHMIADRYLDNEAEEAIRRCEWEANWFSAAFLMPSKAFSSFWSQVGGSLQDVARHFLVSTSAAENRAKSLALAVRT